jgi:hypothetical protein
MFEQHGQLDFENTVRNMLNLGAGSVRLELVIRALPQTYSNKSHKTLFMRSLLKRGNSRYPLTYPRKVRF